LLETPQILDEVLDLEADDLKACIMFLGSRIDGPVLAS
jgi:hypothetical protein